MTQNAQSLYQQALALHHNSDLIAAKTLYQQVILIAPNDADANHMLGLVHYQLGEFNEAVTFITNALKSQPRNVVFLNNHGLALHANKQADAALKSFHQAILLQPKDLDVQLNLGNTFLELARFEEAAGYYRRVLRVKSSRDDIREALCYCLSSLGNQAHAVGNYAQAEACFEEALQFNAQDAALHYNLGNAQRELGKPANAAKSYQNSLALSSNDADAYNNLGNVQRELGQLDLAIKSYEKALQINPKLHHAAVHLVHQKQHICDWNGLEEQINIIRNWVNHIPEAQISPFAFLAMPNTSPAEQKLCADNWIKNRYSTLIEQRKTLDFQYKKSANKRIKIGYLSADFRLHPLAFLVSELLELHDKTQFEIIGFSYGVNDKTPARLRLEKAFNQFYDIRTLSEIDAAKKINSCGIDILVDLTGFTQTSRSGIAALKPAPINVSWLGFAGSMGSYNNAPLFDYILSDSFITPAYSANDYAEKLAQLPCYQPNDRKRPIGKTPTRESCHLPENVFVFCCFNQTFKIAPEVFNIWLKLINKVPNSVLWLLDCNQWAKDNLIKAANLQGVNPSKLIFAPRVSISDHLARHVHADLFLDTLPYNAHTTCSDALWMGLPVLTCVGDTFSARVAGSLLTALDLPELITYHLKEYEEEALGLALQPEKLLTLKEKLIANKAQGILFNTNAFAKSLEAIYKTMVTQA